MLFLPKIRRSFQNDCNKTKMHDIKSITHEQRLPFFLSFGVLLLCSVQYVVNASLSTTTRKAALSNMKMSTRMMDAAAFSFVGTTRRQYKQTTLRNPFPTNSSIDRYSSYFQVNPKQQIVTTHASASSTEEHKLVQSIQSKKDLQSFTVPQLREMIKSSGKNARGLMTKLKKKSDLIDFLWEKVISVQNDVATTIETHTDQENKADDAQHEKTFDTKITPHTSQKLSPKEKSSLSSSSLLKKDTKIDNNKKQISRLRHLMTTDLEQLLQSSHKKSEAPSAALNFIQRMNDLYKETNDPIHKPNVQTYTLLLDAYAKSGLEDAPIQAEEVLHDMIQMAHDEGDESIRPNVFSYTAVIDAYARSTNSVLSNNKRPQEEAERILLQMIADVQQKDKTHAVSPTSQTFDVVLNAWAKCGNYEGAQRAELLFEKMKVLGKKNTHMRPTSYSFATVIKAWCMSGVSDGADRAEVILEDMMEWSKVEYQQQQREERKSGKNGGDTKITVMVKPNVVAFNTVIDAWSRSYHPDAGNRGEALLRRMEEEIQNSPFCTDSDDDDEENSLEPDVITYNSVMNAWINSGHMNAAKKAEFILQKMIRTSSKKGNAVQPNTVSYNTAINAWSKSRFLDAPFRAEQILLHMIETYNRQRREAAVTVNPDAVSFGSVMNTWAKSSEPNKAERTRDILTRMTEMHKSYLETTGTTTTTTTTTRSDKSSSSFSSPCKPNIICYNTVLNACAFSAKETEPIRRKALSIAVSTFQEMKQNGNSNDNNNGMLDVTPDDVTYGNMLKCVANLMPIGEARTSVASKIFYSSCDEGWVSDMVWNEVRRAIPSSVLGNIVKKKQDKGKTEKNDDSKNQKRRKSVGSMEWTELPKDWIWQVKKKAAIGKRKNRRGRGGVGGSSAADIRRKLNKSKKVTNERRGQKDKKEKTAPRSTGYLRPMRTITEISWQSGRDV